MAKSKFKKMPKSPKTTASIDVWLRYEKKVDEIKKYNSSILAEESKKKALIERIRTKIKKRA